MNTRQKLTLGIAAIFMVTLTIVGVTYAFFVTRVTGDLTESIAVQTANVGSIKYVAGNGNTDTVKLDKVLPGNTVYKTFSVQNEGDGNGSYTIFYTSTPRSNVAQFVHATNDSGCYVSSVYPSNTVDNTATAGVTEAPTLTCFDGTAYNNVKITLYSLTEAGETALANKIDAEGNLILAEGETAEDLFTAANVKTEYATQNVKAAANIVNDSATQDLTGVITLGGKLDTNYILKVDYLDIAKNQNIENEAALDIKVSIK